LWAGALLLALTVALAALGPRHACGSLRATHPPIIAFELATSVEALRQIFGPPGACRAAMLASFRTINWLDYLYLLSYGAFLASGLAALSRGRALFAAVVLAMLADAVENICLLSLDVDAPGGWLSLLAVATRTKFVLLGVVSLGFGFGMVACENGGPRLLAFAQVAPLPMALLAAVSPLGVPFLSPSIALSWIAVLAWAAWQTARAARLLSGDRSSSTSDVR
jgi:hypothetical protein